jgi:multisubunit Na+/H+ antiporter MnhB subunit
MSTDPDGAFAWGCIGAIVFALYGLVQICAGYLGIEHQLSTGWAIAAVIAAFALRFTLPITIGAFYGAMNVWGWHWAAALAFAAPGLAFMALLIPGFLASVVAKFRR